jgi:hypothetical protein
MLRIVERVMGEGRIVRGGVELAACGYTLNVYQEWARSSGEVAPAGFVVDGHLLAGPDVLEPLVGASDLVLHLDDGRRLALFLVSGDGAISGVGERGLVRG